MTNSAARNRVKWFVLLLTAGLLAAVILIGPNRFRGNNLPIAPLDGETLESSVPSGAEIASDEAGATSAPIATDTPNTVPAITRPSIDRAGYRLENDVQILTLGGTADEQCEVRVTIGGELVSPVNRTDAGDWAIDVASPDVGTFEVRAECYINNELIAFNARDLQVQAPAEGDVSGAEGDGSGEATAEGDAALEGDAATGEDAAATDESAGADVDATDTTTETVAGEAAAAEAVVEEDVVITGELSDLRFGNDMSAWNAGYLLVRGRGTPGASVAVIFANGEGTVEASTLVNEAGDWAVRGFLDTPGEFIVTARSGENSADVGVVVVASDIQFGGAGQCVGVTAPFGTLENDQYTVNNCEFFGLIANRLGISITELRNANPQILNLNLIQAGNVLNVPPLP